MKTLMMSLTQTNCGDDASLVCCPPGTVPPTYVTADGTVLGDNSMNVLVDGSINTVQVSATADESDAIFIQNMTLHTVSVTDGATEIVSLASGQSVNLENVSGTYEPA